MTQTLPLLGAIPKALTVAGSDSGAGAGIQADLKTFAALGVYGTSAVTAVTAQNTRGVVAIAEVPEDIVGIQMDAVLEDIGADAVKTGMLSSAEIVKVVADRLAAWGISKVVVDPVMVAKSGDYLLQPDAVDAVRMLLLPESLIVTPNIPEAEELAQIQITNKQTARTSSPANRRVRSNAMSSSKAVISTDRRSISFSMAAILPSFRQNGSAPGTPTAPDAPFRPPLPQVWREGSNRWRQSPPPRPISLERWPQVMPSVPDTRRSIIFLVSPDARDVASIKESRSCLHRSIPRSLSLERPFPAVCFSALASTARLTKCWPRSKLPAQK